MTRSGPVLLARGGKILFTSKVEGPNGGKLKSVEHTLVMVDFYQ